MTSTPEHGSHPHSTDYQSAKRAPVVAIPVCQSGGQHEFVPKVIGSNVQTRGPLRESRCKHCDLPERKS